MPPSINFHLEAHEDDENRVRVVMGDGTKGPWFSRLLHKDPRNGVLTIPETAQPPSMRAYCDAYFPEE